MTERPKTTEDLLNPQQPVRPYVSADLYLICRPPPRTVCCRCDEAIDDPTAVNVPGLTGRGWSHRTCLPDSLFS